MIQFTAQDIKHTLKHKTVIKNWIKQATAHYKYKTGAINYIFCTDEYILEINRKYLQHDTYTDIITFDYTQQETKTIAADIFISLDRVGENAKKFGVNTEEELHRVIIHGVLHLLGFKDKTQSDSKQMRQAEDYWLKKLKPQLKQ
jgi:probable rRNA maturation factor